MRTSASASRSPAPPRRRFRRSLITTGHAEHAWLGVQLATVDPSVAGVVRDLPSHGATVVRVMPGSPAAKAGLKASTQVVSVGGVSAPVGGDTIVSVNGTRVNSSSQVADAVALRKPGDTLSLGLVRDGVGRTSRSPRRARRVEA